MILKIYSVLPMMKRYWLLDAGYWMLVAGCLLLDNFDISYGFHHAISVPEK